MPLAVRSANVLPPPAESVPSKATANSLPPPSPSPVPSDLSEEAELARLAEVNLQASIAAPADVVSCLPPVSPSDPDSRTIDAQDSIAPLAVLDTGASEPAEEEAEYDGDWKIESKLCDLSAPPYKAGAMVEIRPITWAGIQTYDGGIAKVIKCSSTHIKYKLSTGGGREIPLHYSKETLNERRFNGDRANGGFWGDTVRDYVEVTQESRRSRQRAAAHDPTNDLGHQYEMEEEQASKSSHTRERAYRPPPGPSSEERREALRLKGWELIPNTKELQVPETGEIKIVTDDDAYKISSFAAVQAQAVELEAMNESQRAEMCRNNATYMDILSRCNAKIAELEAVVEAQDKLLSRTVPYCPVLLRDELLSRNLTTK
ncbi:hypothetical protein TeGR_g13895 [Tetraparma gracilis]|uniref:Uncharacterized protein n=1 Tax=Tetraparma gracilis TaxID=2962635 RepID=A0ABQ6MJ38_9STRA|nr:hypothetical protein TeGR_g13895 [Tetraparma gracilis]